MPSTAEISLQEVGGGGNGGEGFHGGGAEGAQSRLIVRWGTHPAHLRLAAPAPSFIHACQSQFARASLSGLLQLPERVEPGRGSLGKVRPGTRPKRLGVAHPFLQVQQDEPVLHECIQHGAQVVPELVGAITTAGIMSLDGPIVNTGDVRGPQSPAGRPCVIQRERARGHIPRCTRTVASSASGYARPHCAHASRASREKAAISRGNAADTAAASGRPK